MTGCFSALDVIQTNLTILHFIQLAQTSYPVIVSSMNTGKELKMNKNDLIRWEYLVSLIRPNYSLWMKWVSSQNQAQSDNKAR